MRLSRYFLPLLKETPSEAQIVSHRLMLRAGMIRQEAAGIYAWLPLGFRVLKKIEQIVREEMNRAGAIEILMPTLAARRSVARERPLRRLWPRDAAHRRTAMSAICSTAPTNEEMITDIFRAYRALLQGPAAQPLPHPVEVPRRGAPALRRDARPRIPDEGRLFLRPRRGRRAQILQPDVRRLSAHLRAHGPEGHSDARRHRARSAATSARVHHSGRDRREPGLIATRIWSTCRCPATTSTIDGDLAADRRATGPRSMPPPTRCTTRRLRSRSAGR